MNLKETQSPPRLALPLRFGGAVVLSLGFALALFYLLMQPTVDEIGLMAVFLSITSVFTILAGYGAYRLGWISNMPSVQWALLGTYALSILLAFLSVWITARLMFASTHDLLLATILLLFAGGIAMALGHFFSETLTMRIVALHEAANEIASGKLSVSVPVQGRDEMAELATTFNEMAAQLQAAAKKQEEVEKLRRDLIAWIGHDLQTPLASIQAILEALADGVVEDQETALRYLRTAQREIRSLSNLIDDLFQMAQLDAGGLQLDLEPNSLGDLISDTIESFSELAARKAVKLEGRAERSLDSVIMDAPRIGRVLANLVGNALQHTEEGDIVRVLATREEGYVQVEVHDTGDGIPNDDLPYVFDRFYRGEKSRSRATGGAGLGLAIVKGLVEAHGGEIRAQSEPGQGTRITFTLPIQPQ
jgi:signal transduction histidine kinase